MADYSLLEKYESIRHRFEEVGQQITDPGVMSDMKRYVKLNQEYKRLESLVAAFKEYKTLIDNIESGKQILDEETDEDLQVFQPPDQIFRHRSNGRSWLAIQQWRL